jgi:hypothetical protein
MILTHQNENSELLFLLLFVLIQSLHERFDVLIHNELCNCNKPSFTEVVAMTFLLIYVDLFESTREIDRPISSKFSFLLLLHLQYNMYQYDKDIFFYDVLI